MEQIDDQTTEVIGDENGVPVAKQTVETKEGNDNDSPEDEAKDRTGSWAEKASVEAGV